MKKNLIFLFFVSCLFFACLEAIAAQDIPKNIPIPKHLSRQYKKEVEEIINKEYPLIIRKINDYTKEAKKLKNKLLNSEISKGKDFRQEYMDLCLLAEICIPAADLNLYTKIMQTTQEKYINIKYEPFATDNPSVFKDYLQPYFTSNKINKNKLVKITKYANKKISTVEKYCAEVGNMQKD